MLTLLCACSVHAEELFMFVTTTSPPYPAKLVGCGDGRIDILEPTIGHSSISDDDCIILVRPNPQVDLGETTHIELKDGQIFIGQPATSPVSGSCFWSHPRLGQLSIPMDQIEMIHLHPTREPGPFTPSPDFDQILLRNNDVLSGFISEITNPLEIEVDRAGTIDVVEVPWSRISSIHLFGEASPSELPRVWFEDGTIISLPRIDFNDDWWLKVDDHPLIESTGPRVPNPPSLASVHAIAFDSIPTFSLGIEPPVDTDIPPTRMTKPGPHVLDPSAVLGLSPIEISGPGSFHWKIPDGMNRFQASIRLPIPMREWGDVDLEVLVDDDLKHAMHLDGRSPELEIDIPIEGTTLTLRMLEGENGPVQDTIVLEFPMFMFKPATSGG